LVGERVGGSLERRTGIGLGSGLLIGGPTIGGNMFWPRRYWRYGWGYGPPPWAWRYQPMQPAPYYGPPPPPIPPEQELEMLERYKRDLEEDLKDLQEELKSVEERIKELKRMTEGSR